MAEGINMIPDYSPVDMVRLELLAYDNPEGLHPVEQQWRDLARKLKQHIESLQVIVNEHHLPAAKYWKGTDENCPGCKTYHSIKFPAPFKPLG